MQKIILYVAFFLKATPNQHPKRVEIVHAEVALLQETKIKVSLTTYANCSIFWKSTCIKLFILA